MEIGRKCTVEWTVEEGMLAAAIGSGSVKVFGTPMMIAGMEKAAVEAVQSELEEGKTTVGTLVNVTHCAATPLGMKVRFEAELTDISAGGKLFSYKVAAYDERGLIGEGTHQRALVDVVKFEAKTNAK